MAIGIKQVYQDKAFDLVRAERERQDQKWGYAFSPVTNWEHGRLTVLTEEVGEVAHAILEGDRTNELEEWVQVAAVAVAAIEDFFTTPSQV